MFCSVQRHPEGLEESVLLGFGNYGFSYVLVFFFMYYSEDKMSSFIVCRIFCMD